MDTFFQVAAFAVIISCLSFHRHHHHRCSTGRSYHRHGKTNEFCSLKAYGPMVRRGAKARSGHEHTGQRLATQGRRHHGQVGPRP